MKYVPTTALALLPFSGFPCGGKKREIRKDEDYFIRYYVGATIPSFLLFYYISFAPPPSIFEFVVESSFELALVLGFIEFFSSKAQRCSHGEV
jgi:hypothetical protein